MNKYEDFFDKLIKKGYFPPNYDRYFHTHGDTKPIIEQNAVIVYLQSRDNFRNIIISFLLGALITLSGVFLNNDLSNKKDFETKMNVRKNVVLDILEEVNINMGEIEKETTTGFYIDTIARFESNYQQFFTINDSKIRRELLVYFATMKNFDRRMTKHNLRILNYDFKKEKIYDSLLLNFIIIKTIFEISAKHNYDLNFSYDEVETYLKNN